MKERLRRWGIQIWKGACTAVDFLARVADCGRVKISFSRGDQTCYGEIVERIGDQYRVKLFSVGSHPLLSSNRGGFFTKVPVNSPRISRIWRWE